MAEEVHELGGLRTLRPEHVHGHGGEHYARESEPSISAPGAIGGQVARGRFRR